MKQDSIFIFCLLEYAMSVSSSSNISLYGRIIRELNVNL